LIRYSSMRTVFSQTRSSSVYLTTRLAGKTQVHGKASDGTPTTWNLYHPAILGRPSISSQLIYQGWTRSSGKL
jgi:hypothetical protein